MRTPARMRLLPLGLAACLAAPGSAPADVGLMLAPSGVRTELGRDFTVRSTIRNDDRTTATGLIAHLTVFSLTPGTYVDPEDWSSARTRYLRPIPPGGATTLPWKLKAVNGGAFAATITVIAANGSRQTPTIAPPVRIEVAERQTLNAGGILILSVGVPLVLALLTGGIRFRRRRSRPIGRGGP